MYKSIIFDLDGTITDPKVGIVRCVNHALKSFGYQEIGFGRETDWVVGPPLREDFAALLKTRDVELIEKLVVSYRRRYASIGMFENTMYHGVKELLGGLRQRGIDIFVATSKPTIYAKKILEHFGLGSFFKTIVGCELDGWRSSKEEALREVLKSNKLDYESSVMVGDRGHDIVAANRNGIDSIGVLYGYGSREELVEAQPAILVSNVKELTQKLL